MFTNAALNIAADAIAAQAGFVSLHSADPGATGINELAGGAPAYARKAISFAPAALGNADSNVQPVFDVPAGSTVTHVGFWTAATLGTFLGADPVTNEVFAAQGQYRLDDADLSVASV